MNGLYLRRLQILQPPSAREVLHCIRHGIEREGLRVDSTAQLSSTEHPPALGKSLTHPYITTDYSEALLEFITPVFCKLDDVMEHLQELHAYVSRHLQDEFIWAGSMPPLLKGEEGIPIAHYGDSHLGTMKTVYRRGLAARYGGAMQTIAGLHYNFSLPETLWSLLSQNEQQTDASDFYLALIRNFRRYSWLLMYLFGASPALHDSFFTRNNTSDQLEKLGKSTLCMPWATSLRMSGLGYTNNAQSSMDICYNTLDEYVTSLQAAVNTSHSPYEAIGVKQNGRHVQLNTNLLQIENEYYSNIRPKRIAHKGERPLTALSRYGIEYIEVRCLDVNPFEPCGLSLSDAAFLDVFLTFSALMESPDISDRECHYISTNFKLSVEEGRKPGLQLATPDGPIALQQWGLQLIEQMSPIAELLDSASNSKSYTAAVAQQRKKLLHPELTPSAQVLDQLRESQLGYVGWTLERSKSHHIHFSNIEIDDERLSYFDTVSDQSREDQRRLEQESTGRFDDYLSSYFAQ